MANFSIKESQIFDIGCISDVGNKRSINQDRLFYAQKDGIAFLAVADGMGGMQSGEQVSEIAVGRLSAWWNENYNLIPQVKNEAIEDMLSNVINNINSEVIKFCSSNSIKAGTTLTAVLITAENVFFAYLGDTRLYLIRKGKAELLSHDENLYAYMEQMGETNNSVKNKSVLLSYIGKSENVALNFNVREVEQGDMFAVCSDGLYNYFDFTAPDSVQLLNNYGAQAAAEIIQKKVKEGRASDNLSLIILKCR